MRNFLVAACLLLSFACYDSCKKDPKNLGDPGLQGSWELLSMSGGLAGRLVSYPVGNGNMYVFEGATYKQLSNGQTVSSGQYKIVNDTSFLYQRPASRIVFDKAFQVSPNPLINTTPGVRNPNLLITTTPTRMTLTEDVNDGFTYEYRRIMYD